MRVSRSVAREKACAGRTPLRRRHASVEHKVFYAAVLNPSYYMTTDHSPSVDRNSSNPLLNEEVRTHYDLLGRGISEDEMTSLNPAVVKLANRTLSPSPLATVGSVGVPAYQIGRYAVHSLRYQRAMKCYQAESSARRGRADALIGKLTAVIHTVKDASTTHLPVDASPLEDVRNLIQRNPSLIDMVPMDAIARLQLKSVNTLDDARDFVTSKAYSELYRAVGPYHQLGITQNEAKLIEAIAPVPPTPPFKQTSFKASCVVAFAILFSRCV